MSEITPRQWALFKFLVAPAWAYERLVCWLLGIGRSTVDPITGDEHLWGERE